jgi:hypothetical protein
VTVSEHWHTGSVFKVQALALALRLTHFKSTTFELVVILVLVVVVAKFNILVGLDSRFKHSSNPQLVAKYILVGLECEFKFKLPPSQKTPSRSLRQGREAELTGTLAVPSKGPRKGPLAARQRALRVRLLGSLARCVFNLKASTTHPCTRRSGF